jgi:plastocyanin
LFIRSAFIEGPKTKKREGAIMKTNIRSISAGICFVILLIVGLWMTACMPLSINTKSKSQNGQTPGKNGAADKPQEQEKIRAIAEVEIKIENFVFEPPEITIAPGTRVTWINKDDAPHTATSTDNKFNSGGMDTDDKYSFVFNEKGDFPYICTLHPHMKAQIKVR